MAENSIRVDQHNTHVLGSNTHKWQNIYSVNTSFGDVGFENGFILTEPDKVYRDQDPEDGLYLMNPDYEPVAFFSRNGDFAVLGEIMKLTKFPKPHLKAGEVNAGTAKE